MKNSLVQISARIALPLFVTLLGITACDNDKRNKKDKQELQKTVDGERATNAELTAQKKQKEDQILTLELANSEAATEIAKNNETIEKLKQEGEAREKALAALSLENKKLEATRSANQEMIKKLQEDLASIERRLETTTEDLSLKIAEIGNLTAEINGKSQEIQSLTSAISKQDAEIAAMKKASESSKTRIKELEDLLAAGAVGTDLLKELESEKKKSAALTQDLEAVAAEKKALAEKMGSLETEITASKAARTALEQDVAVKEFVGVAAFLENPGPVRLFAVQDKVFSKNYELANGESCLFLFSIDRSAEVTSTENSFDNLSLQGYDVLPIQVGYSKIAVCSKDGVIQAQKETGKIHKIIPTSTQEKNTRHLITAPATSSCDGMSREIRVASVFGASAQFFYPVRGELDGIETMGILRPSSMPLEYNMASSHKSIRANNCDRVLTGNVSNALAKVACSLATGADAQVSNVTMGCFTESSSEAAAKAKLIFNK